MIGDNYIYFYSKGWTFDRYYVFFLADNLYLGLTNDDLIDIDENLPMLHYKRINWTEY